MKLGPKFMKWRVLVISYEFGIYLQCLYMLGIFCPRPSCRPDQNQNTTNIWTSYATHTKLIQSHQCAYHAYRLIFELARTKLYVAQYESILTAQVAQLCKHVSELEARVIWMAFWPIAVPFIRGIHNHLCVGAWIFIGVADTSIFAPRTPPSPSTANKRWGPRGPWGP